MAVTLSFFTLNVWGIPFLSKDVPARMSAIANFLAESTFDIVCLQEVWSNTDFELIKTRVQENLPFSHYFHSGVIGSGLCVFSKHQIVDSLFHQWAVNGYVHKIQHGDWFGGKGVGLCRILVGDQHVNVYTAHLHAEYDRENDEYLSHRVVQAFDTAQFIKLSSSPGDISLVAGDLNTEPTDNAFQIIKHVTGLHDCQDYSNEELMTNEAIGNTYRLMTATSPDAPGKRIDYLLFRPSRGVRVDVKEFGYALPNKVPGTEMSYSDHEALFAILKIEQTKEHNDISAEEAAVTRGALEKAIGTCDEALRQLKGQQWRFGCYGLATLVALVVVHLLLPRVLPDFLLYVSPVLHVVLLLFLAFTIFMATIWHMIELNGIQAGRLGMHLTLNKLKAG